MHTEHRIDLGVDLGGSNVVVLGLELVVVLVFHGVAEQIQVLAQKLQGPVRHRALVGIVRWSRFVGQSGSLAKVYSGV